MTPERTELEIGFAGGGVVRCAVADDEAASLERAYRDAQVGPVALAAYGGGFLLDLGRVVYVRRLGGRRAIGFGGG